MRQALARRVTDDPLDLRDLPLELLQQLSALHIRSTYCSG